MLSLSAPIRVIDGHAVFEDFSDPGQFYVAPKAPAIAMDDQGRPLLSLSQFVGTADAQDLIWGGFLSLQTELAVPAAVFDTVRALLEGEGVSAPKLAALPWRSGTVRLILLGQDSAADPDDDDNTDPDPALERLQIETLGSGKPALDGQGSAAFQVTTSGEAAAFLAGAIKSPAMPALVIYDMEIEGMRRGFNVEVKADWSKVYKELKAKLDLNVYYVRADLENTIKDTLNETGVEIKTEVQNADLADEAARAEKALMDWVMTAFFRPSHQAPDASGGLDGLVDGIGDLITGFIPGLKVELKNLSESETRLLNARLNRTQAERRQLPFQGILGQTLNKLRLDENGQERSTWPDLYSQLVLTTEIPAAPRLQVDVSVSDRFASDGLHAIHVELARGDVSGGSPQDAEDLSFAPGDGAKLYNVSLLDDGPAALGEPYFYRVGVSFDPASSFGSGEAVTGAWRSTRTRELSIDPRIDAPYAITNVKAQLEPGFPFQQFENVSVELRVPVTGDDGSEDFTQHHRFVLTADSPQATWPFRTIGATDAVYEYRAVFSPPPGQGDARVQEWVRTANPLLTLNNPAPAQRPVNIIYNLAPDQVTLAFLELKYVDAEADIHIAEQITLSPSNPMIQRVYGIADVTKNKILYRLTAMISGQFLTGDWRETADNNIVINEALVKEREIKVRLLGLPLSDQALSRVIVDLETIAPSGGVIHRRNFRFEDPVEAAHIWHFPQGDAPAGKIRVKVKFMSETGFSDTVDWQESQRDLVLVNLATKQLVLGSLGGQNVIV